MDTIVTKLVHASNKAASESLVCGNYLNFVDGVIQAPTSQRSKLQRSRIAASKLRASQHEVAGGSQAAKAMDRAAMAEYDAERRRKERNEVALLDAATRAALREIIFRPNSLIISRDAITAEPAHPREALEVKPPRVPLKHTLRSQIDSVSARTTPAKPAPKPAYTDLDGVTLRPRSLSSRRDGMGADTMRDDEPAAPPRRQYTAPLHKDDGVKMPSKYTKPLIATTKREKPALPVPTSEESKKLVTSVQAREAELKEQRKAEVRIFMQRQQENRKLAGKGAQTNHSGTVKHERKARPRPPPTAAKAPAVMTTPPKARPTTRKAWSPPPWNAVIDTPLDEIYALQAVGGPTSGSVQKVPSGNSMPRARVVAAVADHVLRSQKAEASSPTTGQETMNDIKEYDLPAHAAGSREEPLPGRSSAIEHVPVHTAVSLGEEQLPLRASVGDEKRLQMGTVTSDERNAVHMVPTEGQLLVHSTQKEQEHVTVDGATHGNQLNMHTPVTTPRDEDYFPDMSDTSEGHRSLYPAIDEYNDAFRAARPSAAPLSTSGGQAAIGHNDPADPETVRVRALQKRILALRAQLDALDEPLEPALERAGTVDPFSGQNSVYSDNFPSSPEQEMLHDFDESKPEGPVAFTKEKLALPSNVTPTSSMPPSDAGSTRQIVDMNLAAGLPTLQIETSADVSTPTVSNSSSSGQGDVIASDGRPDLVFTATAYVEPVEHVGRQEANIVHMEHHELISVGPISPSENQNAVQLVPSQNVASILAAMAHSADAQSSRGHSPAPDGSQARTPGSRGFVGADSNSALLRAKAISPSTTGAERSTDGVWTPALAPQSVPNVDGCGDAADYNKPNPSMNPELSSAMNRIDGISSHPVALAGAVDVTSAWAQPPFSWPPTAPSTVMFAPSDNCSAVSSTAAEPEKTTRQPAHDFGALLKRALTERMRSYVTGQARVNPYRNLRDTQNQQCITRNESNPFDDSRSLRHMTSVPQSNPYKNLVRTVPTITFEQHELPSHAHDNYDPIVEKNTANVATVTQQPTQLCVALVEGVDIAPSADAYAACSPPESPTLHATLDGSELGAAHQLLLPKIAEVSSAPSAEVHLRCSPEELYQQFVTSMNILAAAEEAESTLRNLQQAGIEAAAQEQIWQMTQRMQDERDAAFLAAELASLADQAHANVQDRAALIQAELEKVYHAHAQAQAEAAAVLAQELALAQRINEQVQTEPTSPLAARHQRQALTFDDGQQTDMPTLRSSHHVVTLEAPSGELTLPMAAPSTAPLLSFDTAVQTEGGGVSPRMVVSQHIRQDVLPAAEIGIDNHSMYTEDFVSDMEETSTNVHAQAAGTSQKHVASTAISFEEFPSAYSADFTSSRIQDEVSQQVGEKALMNSGVIDDNVSALLEASVDGLPIDEDLHSHGLVGAPIRAKSINASLSYEQSIDESFAAEEDRSVVHTSIREDIDATSFESAGTSDASATPSFSVDAAHLSEAHDGHKAAEYSQDFESSNVEEDEMRQHRSTSSAHRAVTTQPKPSEPGTGLYKTFVHGLGERYAKEKALLHVRALAIKERTKKQLRTLQRAAASLTREQLESRKREVHLEHKVGISELKKQAASTKARYYQELLAFRKQLSTHDADVSSDASDSHTSIMLSDITASVNDDDIAAAAMPGSLEPFSGKPWSQPADRSVQASEPSVAEFIGLMMHAMRALVRDELTAKQPDSCQVQQPIMPSAPAPAAKSPVTAPRFDTPAHQHAVPGLSADDSVYSTDSFESETSYASAAQSNRRSAVSLVSGADDIADEIALASIDESVDEMAALGQPGASQSTPIAVKTLEEVYTPVAEDSVYSVPSPVHSTVAPPVESEKLEKAASGASGSLFASEVLPSPAPNDLDILIAVQPQFWSTSEVVSTSLDVVNIDQVWLVAAASPPPRTVREQMVDAITDVLLAELSKDAFAAVGLMASRSDSLESSQESMSGEENSLESSIRSRKENGAAVEAVRPSVAVSPTPQPASERVSPTQVSSLLSQSPQGILSSPAKSLSPRSPSYGRDDVYLSPNHKNGNTSVSSGMSPLSASSSFDNEDEIYDFDGAQTIVIPHVSSLPGVAPAASTINRGDVRAKLREVTVPAAAVWEAESQAYLQEVFQSISPIPLVAAIARGGLPVIPVETYLRLEREREGSTNISSANEEVHIRHKLLFDVLNEELVRVAGMHVSALHRFQHTADTQSGQAVKQQVAEDLLKHLRTSVLAKFRAYSHHVHSDVSLLEGSAAEMRADQTARLDTKMHADKYDPAVHEEDERVVYGLIADEIAQELLADLFTV